MKRIGNLWKDVCTLQNIIEADKRARKGKVKSKKYITLHDKHIFDDNMKLLQLMEKGTFKTSPYSMFTIYEPKERHLAKLPYYPDRIYQHAIMRVLKPVFVKSFIPQTYSCIEGRGIHKCAHDLHKALIKHPEQTTYCLKLDVLKFYPSVNHAILKYLLCKKLKDSRLLKLLYEIIDSYRDDNSKPAINHNEPCGIPIGNYCSQYFANFYLSYFDIWCKQELGCKFYFRYADDIVILSADKRLLHNILIAIKLYFKYKLNLSVKLNYSIFPIDKYMIDFVGYRFDHNKILLRNSIKQNIIHLVYKFITRKITKLKFINSFASYYGWIKHSNSKHLLHKIIINIENNYDKYKQNNSIRRSKTFREFRRRILLL